MSRMPNYSVLGSGPTVLMLHGIGGGHLAFAPQLETLAQAGFRAVSWDMPGYGHSDPIEPYTFKGLAEKCIELIQGLTHTASRPGVSLVGHSMGGMVAQEVVARRPDLVHRLVLCGTSGAFGKPDGDWQQSFVASRMAHLSRAEAEAFYAVHKERPFFKDLVDFMISGPVMIQVLQGEGAILKNRDLMGATDPKKAAPGTIRADFADSIDANAVHGSDGPDTARNEVSFFFAGLNIHSR